MTGCIKNTFSLGGLWRTGFEEAGAGVRVPALHDRLRDTRVPGRRMVLVGENWEIHAICCCAGSPVRRRPARLGVRAYEEGGIRC